MTIRLFAAAVFFGLCVAAGGASADSMTKTDNMKTNSMKTDNMKMGSTKADCMHKAGMEKDSMKKSDMMKSCDAMK